MSGDFANVLTVSIATKDRPTVLDSTLRRLYEFGLGDVEVIVCDDGSSPPLECPSLTLFPRGRLLRNDIPTGQAVARNTIAKAATGAFILQLDDDSYPIGGDIAALLTQAAKEPQWLAYALPFDEPARNRVSIFQRLGVASLRSFVGCSALINKQVFLDIGGYASWIGRMVEEDEICLRAFANDVPVLHADILRIRHDVSATQRRPEVIERLCFRNWMLTWARYAPAPHLVIRAVALYAKALGRFCRHGNLAAFRGVLDGTVLACRASGDRRPLTIAQYRRYLRLPHALDACAVSR